MCLPLNSAYALKDDGYGYTYVGVTHYPERYPKFYGPYPLLGGGQLWACNDPRLVAPRHRHLTTDELRFRVDAFPNVAATMDALQRDYPMIAVYKYTGQSLWRIGERRYLSIGPGPDPCFHDRGAVPDTLADRGDPEMALIGIWYAPRTGA